ncbi:MAG: hypothetical protein JXR37_24820 [Kiritimatiellae bacterium]|nr:hypothetical protein [Kiritimatiellia bacterium]
MSRRRVRVGLAGVSFDAFWGFHEPEYARRAASVRRAVEALGAELVTVFETFRAAEQAEAAARRLNEEADLVILDVATFPEGKAAGAFFDALVPPLILWCRNESKYRTHIGHNSFCGANFLAGNLALRGRRFRKLHGTAGGREFRARLKTAVLLVRAAKQAAGSRIGLIGGGIVPKFHDIDIQPADRENLRRRWRLEFIDVPLRETLARAQSRTAASVRQATRRLAAAFTEIRVQPSALERQARLFLALKDTVRRERLDAVAIRCWPELQAAYEMWPCPTISLLNTDGIPAACEGDPGGALDMLLARRLSDTPTTLLDVVDWDDAEDTLSLWHCGPTACSWADSAGCRLIPHNVDGRSPQGRPVPGLPGVVDMQFAPGPVTVFRTLGAIDDEFVLAGALIPADGQRICGSFGLMSRVSAYGRRTPVGRIRNQILDRALPHHYTAVRGHVLG